MALETDVIVSIAIGVPSCLITLLSLWLAFLTYTISRRPTTRYHILFTPTRGLIDSQDFGRNRAQSFGYYHLQDSRSSTWTHE